MSMLGNHENLGRGPDLPDRRKHTRIQLQSLAYLQLDSENAGVIINISEGGLAFQTAEIITGLVFPRMRFWLPKSNKWLEVSGKLVWEGKSRTEAGIQFIDLNEDVQQQIRSWTQEATLHPNQSREPGRFKIVWEAEGVASAEEDSSTKTDLPSDLDSMFPSEQALPAAPALRHKPTVDDPNRVPSTGAQPKITDKPSSPLHAYDLPIVPPVDGVERVTKQNANMRGPLNSLSFAGTESAAADATVPRNPARNVAGNVDRKVDPNLHELQSKGSPVRATPRQEIPAPSRITPGESGLQRSPSASRPADPLAGRAFYEELMASHSATINAHNLRAAWLSGESPGRKVASSEAASRGIEFTGFGYQPAAFEEPTGKGWFIVAAVLMCLLLFGVVMAVGPANIRSLLLRQAPADTTDVSGPPPPAAALEETAPQSHPPKSSSASSAPTAIPRPDTMPKDVPTDAANQERGQQQTSAASQDSVGTSQTAGERSETPEETEARVRQFQLEHSGRSPFMPPSNDNAAILGQPRTATPQPSPASNPAPPRSERTSDTYAPIPAVPAKSFAAPGTVAISSHFQSISGQESQPGDSLRVGQLASFSQPSYPVEAVRAHVEGTVMLRVLVNQAGTVENVRVVSGPPLLVPYAVNSVRQWRYSQTLLNGRAVGSAEDVAVAFRLGNSAASPR
jgi:TonB family protein